MFLLATKGNQKKKKISATYNITKMYKRFRNKPG